MRITALTLGLISILSLASCNKDDDESILVYEDTFDASTADKWTITGMEDPSLTDPGSAYGNIANKTLGLVANGCTQVTASRSLAGEDISIPQNEKLSIEVNLITYSSGPVHSDANIIRLAFEGFDLRIKPVKSVGSTKLEFEMVDGNFEMVTETTNFEYEFSKNNSEELIDILLRSEGVGDCQSDARLSIDNFKIFRRSLDD